MVDLVATQDFNKSSNLQLPPIGEPITSSIIMVSSNLEDSILDDGDNISTSRRRGKVMVDYDDEEDIEDDEEEIEEEALPT